MPLSIILVWHSLYSWRVSCNTWKLLTQNRIWRIFLRSCYLLKKLLTLNIDTLTDSLSLAMPKEGSVTINSNCLNWLTCEPKEQKCFISNRYYKIFNRCAFWVAEGTAWPTFILIAEGVFCDLMLAEFSRYISDVKVDHLSMVCLFFFLGGFLLWGEELLFNIKDFLPSFQVCLVLSLDIGMLLHLRTAVAASGKLIRVTDGLFPTAAHPVSSTNFFQCLFLRCWLPLRKQL